VIPAPALTIDPAALSTVPHSCTAYRIFGDATASHGELVEMPVADIGGGELLIRSAYASVNYKDALAATGAAPVVRVFPLNGGIDVVGTVAESADKRFAPGDRVIVAGENMNEGHDGGFSEWVRVPADWAVPTPAGLSDWEAAATGSAGITAALAIHRLEHNGLRPGTGPVAVSGATGGTGSMAVAMLAALGYEVTAITGKSQARQWLLDLGASQVEGRPDYAAHTKPLESGRWAGAVDTVGGPMLDYLIRTTLREGGIAAFGNVTGPELTTSVLPFILRAVNLLGINTGRWDGDLRRALWGRIATELKPAGLEAITRTVPFAELPEQFEPFLRGEVLGRVVVDLGGARR
jgi:acrylyl-CoA reductase (NADPH)